MKRNLIYLFLAIVLLAFPDSSSAQFPCFPGDSVVSCCGADSGSDGYSWDLGICDTLYVEPCIYTDTCFFAGSDTICINNPGERFPCFWYVSLFVTHDSNSFYWSEIGGYVQDSIAAFVTPLLFWHDLETPGGKVIFPTSQNFNNTKMDPGHAWFPKSMFRHIVEENGDTIYNRFALMNAEGLGDWTPSRDIDTLAGVGDSGHFFMSLIPVAGDCRKWWEGSRVLLATLTFKVYMPEDSDTIEIGLDSTLWYPTGKLEFTRYDAKNYVPRHFLPLKDTLFLSDSIPFAPAVNYPAGDGPISVFCADLDGDGDLDLAVANANSDSVSILKNNGYGTFESAESYEAGDIPWSVCCADLDGDGDLDLAVANWNGDNVSILKNNGDGIFQPKVDYGAEIQPWSVFCADLDGDGDFDLAVANSMSNNVSVLKNNGDGMFQTAINYWASGPSHSVFSADLDGDLDLDLAVANYWNPSVSILKNNGNGTFQTAIIYVAGDHPRSVFCADLDGDTDLDLAVANDVEHQNVAILRNNGDGTFQTAVNYDGGDRPQSVFCADLDGDLDLDLAVANANSNNVSILKNNGDGTFQTAVNYGAGGAPWSVFCADLDGDGDLDLAVANTASDNVSILKNLTQVPANQPPWPFSLISPTDGDTIFGSTMFHWQTPYDPNFGDQMRYDLYISTSPGFEEPTIHGNLPMSKFTTAMDSGTYYWRVKAKDNWGAERWSTQIWSFESRYLDDTLRIIAFSPVDLVVTDPVGDSISLWFNTIQGATYDTTDYDADGDSDDVITIPDRLVGDYQILVYAEPGGGGGFYDLGIRIDGSNVFLLAPGQSCPPPGEPDTFSYHAPWYMEGDANGDWVINSADIVYLINYLYKAGPTPVPISEAGDANCDGTVNSADIIYLINYLYKGGPEPSC